MEGTAKGRERLCQDFFFGDLVGVEQGDERIAHGSDCLPRPLDVARLRAAPDRAGDAGHAEPLCQLLGGVPVRVAAT